MKEIMLDIKCGCCGFYAQHILYTNEYGYFAFPEAYCPDCLCLMSVKAIGSIKNIEVEDAHKRRSYKISASS